MSRREPAKVWRFVCAAVAAVVAAAIVGAQHPPAARDVPQMLVRIGERVEQWYGRAQSIVALETVWIQTLGHDLAAIGFPRRLEYELRVAWDSRESDAGSLPEAQVLRQLLRVNDRAPRLGDEPGCMDPRPVSPEPLAMLLAPARGKFTFAFAGAGRTDRREALMLDYKSIRPEPAAIEWRDDCVSVSLPGRARGRIWIDPATHDVLRLDEHLVGLFEFDVPDDKVRRGATASMTIERADASIRYARVLFRNPDESLMLPSRIETMTVIRGGGIQRHRITQRFSNYRRFVTEGRIVR